MKIWTIILCLSFFSNAHALEDVIFEGINQSTKVPCSINLVMHDSELYTVIYREGELEIKFKDVSLDDLEQNMPVTGTFTRSGNSFKEVKKPTIALGNFYTIKLYPKDNGFRLEGEKKVALLFTWVTSSKSVEYCH